MNDWYKNLKRAKEILDELFCDVGKPVKPNEEVKKARLNQYEQLPNGNSFYLLFDVRSSQIPIKWVSRHLKYVLGYNSLGYEEWLSIIHPDFLRIYLEFGVAAYKLSIAYKDDLISRERTSYTINVPVKSDLDGEYWMFTQESQPFQFDKEGRMVSHINIYTKTGRFDKYQPRRPFVFFDTQSQDQIVKEILEHTQKSVLTIFFPEALGKDEIKESIRKSILAYWFLFSEYMAEKSQRPTTEMVAERRGLSPGYIEQQNKELKRLAKMAFPITDFSNAVSVVEFLYTLFGPINSDGDVFK